MTTKTSHLVLKLKDELSGPAGKAAGALGKVGDAGKGLKKLSGASAEVQRLSQNLSKLQGQLGKVESFRGIQADFAAARTRFRSAQTEVQRLAREMAAIDKPTQKMATAFARAQREVRSAAQAFERQRTAIVAAKRAMETACVPIDKLAAAEKRLKSAIDQTNTSLSFQKRVEARAHQMAPTAHAPLIRGGAASAAYGAAGGVLVGMGGPLLGAAGAGFAIKQATESSLSLEKTMTEVARATDASGTALKAYEQKVLDIARATGKTKEEIGSMLASAGFAGRPAQELVRFTEYASKATTAWGTTAEDTGQALAEIGNIFRAHQARIEEIGDAVNTVADGAAASEPDLLEFIRRAGAVGDQAGFTAEQVISFGAAFKEIGTRTDVAATAFNALVNSLTLGAEFTKHAEEGFKALGINIRKFQKSFVSKPLETTLELLEKITAIKDPLKRASILNDIYGKEYGDDIARLTGNMEGLHRILGMVADRTKYLGSVQKNFDTAINTDVNKIARATQALDVLAARAGNAFKVIAGGAAQEVNSLVDSIEKGDSLFQRVLGRYNAQLKKAAELEGRLRPDGKIDMGEPAFDTTSTDNWFDRNAPWLSGKRWREDFDSWLGTTGDEAARKGREAAIEEHFRKQREMVNERDRLRKRNADAGGNRVVFDEKTGRYMARDVAEAELSHIEE
ncbi:hypothetical protein CHELA40_10251 [Chelatococcus asaccharovorans]|nr:hypothetical protein CHELA40_10251 [Chelatococcus asaccharovorans]CAH1686940.1 hypothetical protein CHELA17_65358 [Chelatococcus asaccharovorans]